MRSVEREEKWNIVRLDLTSSACACEENVRALLEYIYNTSVFGGLITSVFGGRPFPS